MHFKFAVVVSSLVCPSVQDYLFCSNSLIFQNKMDFAHRTLDVFPCSANQEINLTWPNERCIDIKLCLQRRQLVSWHLTSDVEFIALNDINESTDVYLFQHLTSDGCQG